MADHNTVARPYAKAIFEFALAQKKMAEWSAVLNCLTQIVSSPLAIDFIRNPSSTPDQQSELILAVMTQSHAAVKQEFVNNLVQLLAHNKRLLVLPNISAQYDALRAEYEKTLQVDVISFAPLTSDQEERLVTRLSHRLQRRVSLNMSVDRSLRGGVIVRAGHLVFDASVETQIKKLAAALAA